MIILAGGPVGDCCWLVSAEDMVREIEARQTPVIGGTGFSAKWWIEDRKNRLSLNAAGGKNSGISGFRIQLRIDGRENRKHLEVSPSFELGSGRWRLQAGPARGGMGSGLIVGERAWNTVEAGVRSAWSGVPTGLRAGPVSSQYARPQVIALQYRSRQQVLIALLRGLDSTRFLAVEWRPVDAVRAVLLRSSGFSGAEFTAGVREGSVRWRISAAGWGGAEDLSGGSVEASASWKEREASWEMRLWGWCGACSPLAPPPIGAAEDRRLGGRIAVEMQPAEYVKVAAALETAIDNATDPVSLWWRSQVMATCGSSSNAGVQLRLRRTDQETMEPWIDQRRQMRWLMDLRLRSGPAGNVRWYGGLRRQVEAVTGRSDGIWLQVENIGTGLKWYVRGTLSRPSSGIPLYWFEPGPAYGWNLHMETMKGIRLLTGILEQTGGWHFQLIAEDGGSVGFKVAWRSGR